MPPVGDRRRRGLPRAPAARARAQRRGQGQRGGPRVARAPSAARSRRRASCSQAGPALGLLTRGADGALVVTRDRRGAGARAARPRSSTRSAPATRSAAASSPGGARRASGASSSSDRRRGRGRRLRRPRRGADRGARGRLAPVPARARARRAAGAGRGGLSRPPAAGTVLATVAGDGHRTLPRLRHPARGRARRHGRGLPRHGIAVRDVIGHNESLWSPYHHEKSPPCATRPTATGRARRCSPSAPRRALSAVDHPFAGDHVVETRLMTS